MLALARRLFPALLSLPAAAWLISAGNAASAQAPDDGLAVTANVTYDVQTAGVPVRVTWDVTIVNNDPSTTDNGSGTVFFYDALGVPVLRGATNANAIDSGGVPLDVLMEDIPGGIVQRGTVAFDDPLFFGETYVFSLAYDLTDVHSQTVLVTQNYTFFPAVAAGDSSTVTVRTPTGDPWEVSVEARECEGGEGTFTCSGSESGYLAAIVEVSQPAAKTTLTFEVPLQDAALAVSLTYFLGEEAAAQHHQQLIAAALPEIERAYGFDYAGPSVLNVSQGGRQEILGYEGLASCGDASCEVVVSPIADDYTVLHELSHLWSGTYAERWLSEGFAQLIPEEVTPLLPPGLVNGEPPQRMPATVGLQLDDWGYVEPVIGASEDEIAVIDAGYDYSLRFLDELRAGFGMETLRSVNRNIATGGVAADSRLFMDVLEEATQENLDNLFLVWVFPDSYQEILTQRRSAKDRLAALRIRLSDEGLSDDPLLPIEQDIRDWDFVPATESLTVVESDLETYAELGTQLSDLQREASNAGLSVPESIGEALRNFEFETVRGQLADAREAIDSYTRAAAAVDEPRGILEDFGLLGRDPEGDLRDAEESFASGGFSDSRDQSEATIEMIEDADAVAIRRFLIIAGIFAVLALAIGIAIAVGQIGRRDRT